MKKSELKLGKKRIFRCEWESENDDDSGECLVSGYNMLVALEKFVELYPNILLTRITNLGHFD